MLTGRESGLLSAAEAAAALAKFASCRSVLLAVSGGADSTALLVLAARFAAAEGRPKLVVATVDHGLREGSRGEAEAVGSLAARFGIPHRILTWHGAKPVRGVEARAREARYALLVDCAAAEGCDALATAHTRDDQAETVLLRLAAGSGPAGLAAMRAETMRGGVRHLRPLLDTPNRRLLATLAAEGIGCADDPMNADLRVARVRLRRAAAVLAREGLTPQRLATLARRMTRAEDALERATDAACAAIARLDAAGHMSLDGAALLGVPPEIGLRVLGRAVSAAGEGALRLARLETLFDDVSRSLAVSASLGRTLAGAKIAVSTGGSVVVTRAPPRRMRAAATEPSPEPVRVVSVPAKPLPLASRAAVPRLGNAGKMERTCVTPSKAGVTRD